MGVFRRGFLKFCGKDRKDGKDGKKNTSKVYGLTTKSTKSTTLALTELFNDNIPTSSPYREQPESL